MDTPDLLSEGEARQLAVLSAILTDDESKKRIAAMRAAQEEHDNALKRLQVQQQVNEQSIRVAQAKLSEAATMAANAEARSRELDAREKTMGEALAAINAEKAAWEAVRQRVEAGQKAKAEELAEKAKSLAAAVGDINRRSDDLAEHEKAARTLHDTYWAKHKRLREVLQENLVEQ
jgi:hypothetical protein